MPTKTADLEEFEASIRRNQRTADEVARLAEGKKPFSYREWQRIAPPATEEELAEMAELLHQREVERDASLAREVCTALVKAAA